jgi:putative FmdB family regulatory protein
MPTYEYRCKDCGHDLEAVQGFHDEPLTECPACGGTLRKKFGSVGISFKGSGFYKNDSRASTSKSESTSAESTSTDSKGSSDTSTSSSSSSSDSNGAGSSSDSGSKSKTPAPT